MLARVGDAIRIGYGYLMEDLSHPEVPVGLTDLSDILGTLSGSIESQTLIFHPLVIVHPDGGKII